MKETGLFSTVGFILGMVIGASAQAGDKIWGIDNAADRIGMA